MSPVLDSTVLIDVLRGLSSATAYLQSLSEIPFCSEISRIEVTRGLRSHERGVANSLFGVVSWVPIDEVIARRAGELGRAHRQTHGLIDAAHLAIAATADVLHLPLATSDVRHFPMFAGLVPPY